MKYFEEVGGAHYRGECFVFDERVSLNGELKETGSVLCDCCQMPVTVAEQNSKNYIPGISCPYCADKGKTHSF